MKLVLGFLLCVGVYLLNWAAVFGGLYRNFEWIDIPMHLLGGIVAGVLVIGALELTIKKVEYTKLGKKIQWFVELIVVVAGVALMATLWEFHEFILDSIREGNIWLQLVAERAVGTHQPSVTDTMIDFAMGLTGGVIAFVFDRMYERSLGR